MTVNEVCAPHVYIPRIVRLVRIVSIELTLQTQKMNGTLSPTGKQVGRATHTTTGRSCGLVRLRDYTWGGNNRVYPTMLLLRPLRRTVNDNEDE